MLPRLRENLFPLIAGWVTTVAFDLFLHGGLLANLYTRKSPFLLSAELAFGRIVIGYISFLILCALLLWLMVLTGIKDKFNGFRFGLKFGLLAWGGFLIGLYSISTAPIELLLGWWIGQAVELGLAGFVIGARFEGVSRKRITVGIVLFFVAMIALTVLLQAAGFARPMKVV